jgi:hypothetical protein
MRTVHGFCTHEPNRKEKKAHDKAYVISYAIASSRAYTMVCHGGKRCVREPTTPAPFFSCEQERANRTEQGASNKLQQGAASATFYDPPTQGPYTQLASREQYCYFSGDASLPSETRERIIEMNRKEETMKKEHLDKRIEKGDISEEEAVSECEACMKMWAPGQRVFPVLPGYIQELQARIEASTAD